MRTITSLSVLFSACLSLLSSSTTAQSPRNWALGFDGIDDLARILSSKALQLPGDFTWEAWVKLDFKSDRDHPIFTALCNPRPYSWSVSILRDGRLQVVYLPKVGFGRFRSNQGHIKVGKWTHIAVVFDKNVKATLFVNGSPVPATATYGGGAKPGDPPDHTGEKLFSLGEYTDNVTAIMHGSVDEIRFWSRALSGLELRCSMWRKLSGGEPGLQALWRLDLGRNVPIFLDWTGKGHLGWRGRTRKPEPVDPKWVPGPGNLGDLILDKTSLSVSKGGSVNFHLRAGCDHAGKIYLLLGSNSGTHPGIRLGSHRLPLNPDNYFLLTLVQPNTWIAGSLGRLDARGLGSARLTLPPGALTGLQGSYLHHAYLVVGTGLDYTSRAVSLFLTP